MPVRIAELEIRIRDNLPEVTQRVEQLNQLLSRPLGSTASGETLAPLLAGVREVRDAVVSLSRQGASLGSALSTPVRQATQALDEYGRTQRAIFAEAGRDMAQRWRAQADALQAQARAEAEVARMGRAAEQERQRTSRAAVAQFGREANAQVQAMQSLSRELLRLNDPRREQRQAAGQDPRVQSALARFDAEQRALAASLGNWSQYTRERERLEDQLVNQVIRSQNEQNRAIEQSTRERERLADQQRASFERMFSAGRQGAPGIAGLAIGGIGDLLAPKLGAAAGPAGLAAGMLSNVAGQLTGGITSLIGRTVETVFSGVRELVSGVASLAQSAVQGVIGIFTGIAGVIGNTVGAIKDFFGEVARGAATLGLAYLGVKTLQAAFDALLSTTVEFNATLERSQASWGRFLRPMEETGRAASEWAKDMQMYIQQTAVATSFGFSAVDRSARQLLQAGLSLGDILPDARTGVQGLQGDILDLAASQQDPLKALDRLSLALGQVKQAGRLTGEEMRQLRNDGVSIPEVFAKIAEQLGVTTGKVYEMQRAGELTSDIFFKGFRAWTQQNFGGLAQAQAATLIGAWEQIKEAANVVLGRGTEPAFRLFSEGMQSLAKAITGPEALQMAARFAGWTEAIIAGVQRLWEGFRGPLSLILALVQETGHKIYEGLQWLNPFARHSPSLVESVEEGVQRVIDAYSRMGREVPELLGPIASAMTNFRAITSAGLEQIDLAQFTELSKALVNIAPGAPAAYRELQLAIRGIREEAATLSPEIVIWTNRVRELEAANAEAKRGVDEAKDAVAAAEAELRHYDTAIREHRQSQLELQVQLALVKEEYQAQADALRPLEDALDAQNRQVAQMQRAYTLADLDVRKAEQGLRSFKEAVDDQNLYLGKLQDQLNRSRDALGGVNDQLSETKQRLSDVLSQPLEGTAKYTQEIQAAQTAVERIQLSILNRRASGATSSQLEGLNRQLDRARATMELLQQRKRLEIDLPEERIRALADIKGPELSLGDKEASVRNLTQQVGLLDRMKQAAEQQVRARQSAVRDATEERNRLKEMLDIESDRIEPLRRRRDLLKEAAEMAGVERDILKEQLAIQKDELLQPIQDRIDATQRLIDREQAALQLLELQKQQAYDAFVQPPLDAQEEVEHYQEKVNRDLTGAKENLNDLVTAQRALLSLAQAWQSELDEAANKAKSYASILKDANKDTAGGTNDRTAGGEALSRFRAAREALAREQAQAKADFEVWWAGLIAANDSQGQTLAVSFLGRLRGLASGLVDSWQTALRDGFGAGITVLWETIQDVASGLPGKLGEWTGIFLGWVGEAAEQFAAALNDVGTPVVAWITGQNDPIRTGLTGWLSEFTEWAAPAWEGMKAKLDAASKSMLAWVQENSPALKGQLMLWLNDFVDWAKPIWDLLSVELTWLWHEALAPWIGDRAKDIWNTLTDPNIGWVPKFWQWVNGPAWNALEPELEKYGDKIVTWAVSGDGGLKVSYAGGVLATKLVLGSAAGLLRAIPVLNEAIVKTIESAMTGAVNQLTDSVGTWLHDVFITGAGYWALDAYKEISSTLYDTIAQSIINVGTALHRALANFGAGLIGAIAEGIEGKDPSGFLTARLQRELEAARSTLEREGRIVAPRLRQPSAPTTPPGVQHGPPFERLDRPPVAPVYGPSIEEGMLNGLDFSNAQQRTIRGIDDLIGSVEDRLEIHSPSAVFERMGQSIGQGLANGIEQSTGAVLGAMNNIMSIANTTPLGAAGGMGSFSVSRYTNVADDPAYQRWLELFGPKSPPPPPGPPEPWSYEGSDFQRISRETRRGGAFVPGQTEPPSNWLPFGQYLQPAVPTPVFVAAPGANSGGGLGLNGGPADTGGTGQPGGRRDQPPGLHYEPHVDIHGAVFGDADVLARILGDRLRDDLLDAVKGGGR